MVAAEDRCRRLVLAMARRQELSALRLALAQPQAVASVQARAQRVEELLLAVVVKAGVQVLALLQRGPGWLVSALAGGAQRGRCRH